MLTAFDRNWCAVFRIK